VIEGSSRDEPPSQSVRSARFRVIEIFKGVASQEVVIGYHDDGGKNTGWSFRIGHIVTVFAHLENVLHSAATDMQVNGYANYCSMTLYLHRARAYEGVLRLLKESR
jgi:hypothetical protein